MFTSIGDGAWRTRHAAPPVVGIETAEDEPTRISLTYQIEPAPLGADASFVRLDFDDVLLFRFGDFDGAHPVSNPTDTAFDVVRVLNSGWLERVLTEGPDRWRPAGQRLGGVLSEDAPQHYRITFDDHGTYDILCTGVTATPCRRTQDGSVIVAEDDFEPELEHGGDNPAFEDKLDLLTTQILVPLRGDKTLDIPSLDTLNALVRRGRDDGLFDSQIKVRLAAKLWSIFTAMLAEAGHARNPEPILRQAWRYQEELRRAFGL